MLAKVKLQNKPKSSTRKVKKSLKTNKPTSHGKGTAVPGKSVRVNGLSGSVSELQGKSSKKKIVQRKQKATALKIKKGNSFSKNFGKGFSEGKKSVKVESSKVKVEKIPKELEDMETTEETKEDDAKLSEESLFLKDNKLRKRVEELKKFNKKSFQLNPNEHVRGCVYFSHLPHGFYDEELKGYFSQFGQVTGVYVPRSRKTNRPKGFAFVEFLHPEVADVVADTMNNYLMFDKLLTAEVVPAYKQRPKMFKGKYKTRLSNPQKNAIKKLNKANSDHKRFMKSALKRLNRMQEMVKELGFNIEIQTDVPLPSKPIKTNSTEDIKPVIKSEIPDNNIMAKKKCLKGIKHKTSEQENCTNKEKVKESVKSDNQVTKVNSPKSGALLFKDKSTKRGKHLIKKIGKKSSVLKNVEKSMNTSKRVDRKKGKNIKSQSVRQKSSFKRKV